MQLSVAFPALLQQTLAPLLTILTASIRLVSIHIYFGFAVFSPVYDYRHFERVAAIPPHRDFFLRPHYLHFDNNSNTAVTL